LVQESGGLCICTEDRRGDIRGMFRERTISGYGREKKKRKEIS